jgi:hypothetical protein
MCSLGNEETEKFRHYWQSHYHRALRIAIVVMVPAAVARHAYELWRLLFAPSPQGAIDLHIHHRILQAWFAHQPVYQTLPGAVYPPALYPILWPFLGWLSFPAARWLWAATAVAAIIWLAYLVARESLMQTGVERTGAALFLVANYATAITIGNGQFILHILPALLSAALLLKRRQASWGRDLIASSLFVTALAKPSISAPFGWIVLFVPGSIRPFVLVSLSYVGLTVWSASYQDDSLVGLFRAWLERSSSVAVSGGHGNIHIWLSELGMEELLFPASLLALVVLGVWTYRHRNGDVWHLLGVSAIVARVWTYHRMYDDLLILLPMVALARTARSGPQADRSDVIAGFLLAAAWVFMLVPGTLARVPWGWPFRLGQALLWAAMLLFLVRQASKLTGSRASEQTR